MGIDERASFGKLGAALVVVGNNGIYAKRGCVCNLFHSSDTCVYRNDQLHASFLENINGRG